MHAIPAICFSLIIYINMYLNTYKEKKEDSYAQCIKYILIPLIQNTKKERKLLCSFYEYHPDIMVSYIK